MKQKISQNILLFIITIIVMQSCRVRKPKTTPIKAPVIEQTVEPKQEVENTKAMSRKVVRGNTKEGHIRKIERIYAGSASKLETAFDDINISDNFDMSSKKKFPKATFYPIGKYSIDDDKIDEAIEVFKPLVDIILNNAKDNKIKVQILVNGFTDGSPFSTKSKTYIAMCNLLEKTKLSKQEFINQLSFQRATAISEIITTIIEDKMESFESMDEVQIDIITEGKGENLPEPTRQYQTNDERRRIAKIYYNIL